MPSPYAHAPRLPDGDTVDLGSLVAGDGPILLEIGSGRGAFALGYAARHPEGRVVALEIRRKWAQILDERFRAKGLRARCFAEDARAALPRLGPDGGVAAAAVHFPDPWWKKRHAKRLVVQDDLVDQLARLVAPGGVVLVQTDVEDRAAQYAARFDAAPAFENVAGEGGRADESPFAPARSNREARAIADGLPVFRLVYRRR